MLYILVGFFFFFNSQEKDLYGNEVARLARPLPVEYLLVDVPTATPLTPKYTLANSFLVNPFPIENRYAKFNYSCNLRCIILDSYNLAYYIRVVFCIYVYQSFHDVLQELIAAS